MWPCGDCECDAHGVGNGRWHIPGVIKKTGVCARRMVTDFSWQMLSFHKHYVNGNLAVPGGVTSQPGVYLEIMEIISEWMTHGKSGDG